MKAIRIILAIVFVWSMSKTFELLFRSGSMDRVLFEAAGLSWLFWSFFVPLALLQAGAVYFVVDPRSRVAFRAAVGAVILGFVETATASALALGNPELLRQAIITSRTERGLAVRPEVLRLAESPVAQLLPAIVSAILGCVWLFLVVRMRTHARAGQMPLPATPSSSHSHAEADQPPR